MNEAKPLIKSFVPIPPKSLRLIAVSLFGGLFVGKNAEFHYTDNQLVEGNYKIQITTTTVGWPLTYYEKTDQERIEFQKERSVRNIPGLTYNKTLSTSTNVDAISLIVNIVIHLTCAFFFIRLVSWLETRAKRAPAD